jgi:hypothetical protein
MGRIALPSTIIACVLLFCGAVDVCASDNAAYCASMQYCLEEMPAECSEEDFTRGDLPREDSYCAIFKELQQRGLRSSSWQGRQIYRQVSAGHRVEYAQQGTLPMPAEVLTYLMNNLPFAAELVNAYQDTDFQAAYLDTDKKRFTGSGERLSGTFTTMLQNDNQTRSLYSGYGKAGVLAWRLRGTALIMFDFEETGVREITYNARCFVFPRSAVVRSILNFFLFRKSITGLLERTFGYIEDSALAFHRGDYEPIEKHPAFTTQEGRQQIRQFQALLQRTMGAEEQRPALPDSNTRQQSPDALQP